MENQFFEQPVLNSPLEDPRIQQLLDAVKADERSSPAGLHWQRFYEFLCSKPKTPGTKPSVPLILAASAEPEPVKHRRLGDQLRWAQENDCLDEAIELLESMPSEHWNHCPIGRWNRDGWGDYE